MFLLIETKLQQFSRFVLIVEQKLKEPKEIMGPFFGVQQINFQYGTKALL